MFVGGVFDDLLPHVRQLYDAVIGEPEDVNDSDAGGLRVLRVMGGSA